MIVVFLVVLVVFGPQKLPELARSLGKLMAEFRKASGDFKSAFEDEIRDLERQARIAELKKQASEAVAAAKDGLMTPVSIGSPEGTPSVAPYAEVRATEAPVVTPAAEAVPRLDASASEIASANPQEVSAKPASGEVPSVEVPAGEAATNGEKSAAAESTPSHDQQQPA